MYRLIKPTPKRIQPFIDRQSALDFTYPSVGATKTAEHPPGYVVDHHRIRLGSGRDVYTAAIRALGQWRHYEFDWIELHRDEAAPQPNQTVGVLARALGLWVLNACRVVYVIEETEPLRRFAFAYGTLPEHAESGEERFQVEWRTDDSVWYDIFAFSRPNQLLARLAHPYVRRKQKQFARQSLQAMQRVINDE